MCDDVDGTTGTERREHQALRERRPDGDARGPATVDPIDEVDAGAPVEDGVKDVGKGEVHRRTDADSAHIGESAPDGTSGGDDTNAGSTEAPEIRAEGCRSIGVGGIRHEDDVAGPTDRESYCSAGAAAELE